MNRLASERGIQALVATHDKDFIAGLLMAQAQVTVVRLIREGDSTDAVQLSAERLREVWDDRNLRYSNVLDGLFSRIVVLAEAEQDCRFYEAVFDSYHESWTEGLPAAVPATDILFVPSGGKNGVATAQQVLGELRVPTLAILDIDALDSPRLIEQWVGRVGGDWNKIESLLRVALSSVKPGDWVHVKRSGDRFFSSDQRIAFDDLLTELDELGLFVVRVRELEGFARSHPKNREWLRKALAEGAHEGPEARALAERVMHFHERA